jgi:hypothetical protein
MAFNWNCPYCDTKTTINKRDYKQSEQTMTIENSEGSRKLVSIWIVCTNTECKRITLTNVLYNCYYESSYSSWETGDEIKKWRLLPGSYAKSFPNYIPKPLIADYEEASAIIDLSPKASATLSRRCLQGIIRDFWVIKKGRLVDEINALEEKIDPLTWQSIDAVTKVGNIGAHVEKDINLIIDVEPKEAYLLIELIELLFEEWYVHRHEREKKLKAISEITEAKAELKKKK